MVKFIPVRYSEINYPDDINPQVQERAANFARISIDETNLPYISLHTDPAYGWNKSRFLPSDSLDAYKTILNNLGVFGQFWVPKLWFNEEWSKEFSRFLINLLNGIDHRRIKIIEIHPPFSDYCDSFDTFIERYGIFEDIILKEFPETVINIENRFNRATYYRDGKFLLSDNASIKKLARSISNSGVKLRIVLDLPQLLLAHYRRALLSGEKIKEVLTPIKEVRDFISSVHISGRGKKGAKGPHQGNLNTFFNDDKEMKECFLAQVIELFDDGTERYFVPEVGCADDMEAIISDLKKPHFQFVEISGKGKCIS